MAVISALSSIIRGLVGAIIGLILGYGLSLFVTSITGRPVAEIAMAISYPIALIGWLLGVGVWKAWAKDWVGLEATHSEGHGWRRFFTFSLDHKVIGVQYLTTFVILFLLAGLLAMLIRIELISPGAGIMDAGQFNTVMGLHVESDGCLILGNSMINNATNLSWNGATNFYGAIITTQAGVLNAPAAANFSF